MSEILADEDSELRRRKHFYLLMIPSIMEITILMSVALPERSAIAFWGRLAFGFLVLFFILSWCFADARQHSIVLSRFMILMIVALALVGVPYYLIRSRGRKAWGSLAWCALYCFGILVMFFVTGIMVGITQRG